MGIYHLPGTDLLDFPDDFTEGPLFTASPMLHRLREERPVAPVKMPSGSRLWLITRYSDVRMVMSDPRFSRQLAYAGAPRMAGEDLTSVPGSLFNMEGKEHTRVRNPLNSYFTRHAMYEWKKKIQDLASSLLREMTARKREGDLVQEFSEPLVAQLACALMGTTEEEHIEIQGIIRRQLDLRGTSEDIAEATSDILEFAQKLAERSSSPAATGPTAALVQAANSGEISEQEAVASISLLLMNATDPLIPPLTTGPMTLLLHRQQLDQCIARPELWPTAAAEVLRYHNNGTTNFPRVALCDALLGGVEISKGEGVITSNLAASHDPDHFSNPEIFDIHRADRRSIFFGAGPHFCLGATFGPMVLATAYEAVFSHIPTIRMAADPYSIKKADDGFFARPKTLPVQW
jgi:cytochrome P450